MEVKQYKLGEVTINHDKKRVPLSSMQRAQRKGIYRYYGAQGIIDFIDDYIFDGTYLLIAEDGENLNSQKQNIAQIVDGQFWVNNHAHIVQTNEKCNLNYLSYLINSMDLSGYITGSAQPKLSQANLNAIELYLPKIEIQEQIVSVLNCLEKKIANNSVINQNLIEQVGSLFEQQFGRFFGEDIIPDGWRVTEISALDVLVTDYVANGSFKSLADNVEYLDSETDNVLIRLTDYNNNYNSDMVYISDSAYEFLSKSKLFGDEIIISNVGANVGTVFRCPRLSKRMSLGPNAIMIRSQLYEHYLFQLFTSRYGQHLLQSIVTGSAQPKFNKTNFRSLKVLIPDRDTLESFNAAYSPINEMIVQNNLQNRSLSSLRDSLLPKLMSGELDVSEIEL